jgi:hypothetical protein
MASQVSLESADRLEIAEEAPRAPAGQAIPMTNDKQSALPARARRQTSMRATEHCQ